MAITLWANAMNGAPGRAHKPVTISCSSQEPTVIKCLAVIACVVGVTLLAGAGANACGSAGEKLLASPASVQSEAGLPQPAPKDQESTQQEGK